MLIKRCWAGRLLLGGKFTWPTWPSHPPELPAARPCTPQVFASGKDRNSPSGPLHTSFKLSSGDGYLALLAPDGSVVSEVQFPE